MEIRFYTNKRNPNKHLEVHHSDCGHYTVCQFMQWKNVTNWISASKRNVRTLKRWKKRDLEALLEDYIDTTDKVLMCNCSFCGKQGTYIMNESEKNLLEQYNCYGRSLGYIQNLFPNVPAWIRSGAIDKYSGGFCICPDCF